MEWEPYRRQFIPEEEDVEDAPIVALITPLLFHQQELIDEFKSFKHKNAPPVVHSLKTAEASVDAARDTFAECAKQFVHIMTTMSTAFNEENAAVKADMHQTYVKAIEDTNTGTCFRGLYNDDKHTMAPFDSEKRHILSAQAIFAPFNIATLPDTAVTDPSETKSERDAAVERRRLAQQRRETFIRDTAEKEEYEKLIPLYGEDEFALRKNTAAATEVAKKQVDIDPGKKSAADRSELDSPRAVAKKNIDLDPAQNELKPKKKNSVEVDLKRNELEKKRAADLAQKKEHVKQQVRKFICAGCPPCSAPAQTSHTSSARGPRAFSASPTPPPSSESPPCAPTSSSRPPAALSASRNLLTPHLPRLHVQ
jgi:hypothetical protein